jgi:hypothetical protein
MKVKLVWKDCNFLNGEWSHDHKVTSYWVESEPGELDKIVAYAADPDRLRAEIEENKADNGNVYLLISADLKSIISLPVYYPYAGQWNAYNPFEEIPETEISDLKALSHLLK